MDEVTQEIRQALLGNLVTQDKRLVVTDSWIIKYRYGLVDGFDHVLVFGVMRKMRWYQMPGSREQIKEQLRAKGQRCEAYNVGAMWQDYEPQTLAEIIARQGRRIPLI